MRSVTDIASDVAAGDVDAIETAFRALVSYPEVEAIGPPSPDALTYILEHVAEALKDDTSPMPAAAVDAIEGVQGGTEALAGADYASGSAKVLAHLGEWRLHYDRTTEPGVIG